MITEKISIPETIRKYKLTEIELACIAIYLSTGNKSFAWSQTVGIKSQSPNKSVLAGNWFKNHNVSMMVFDKENENSNYNVSTSDVYVHGKIKDPKKNIEEEDGINAENIKALLESEFNKTKDPEKRTTLLIKIADFLSLNKTNDEDFQTPLIYLPARCKDCTFKK
jgi:hypothetical protein